MENKHIQQVDFSNPNALKINSGTTVKQMQYKKQTAVEWLIEQLPLGIRMNLAENGIDLNQAKAMEKEQIIDANRNGVDMVIDKKPFITGEQYYNETYGK